PAGGRRRSPRPNTRAPELPAHHDAARGAVPDRGSGSSGTPGPASPEVAADRLLPGVARQVGIEQRGRHAALAHLVRADADLFEQTVPDPPASGCLRLDEDVARPHMLLIAADRTDVEIAGQPLVGV